MKTTLSPFHREAGELKSKRTELRGAGQTIVLTNGCFDILHAGHVAFLEKASQLGDVLWIGLNSDASVRALKGPDRPIHRLEDRARVLGALRWVDAVFAFDTVRCDDAIRQLRPEHYAKAGDYTLETLDPREREALEAVEATIHLLPFEDGLSTTGALRKLTTRPSNPPFSQ